MAIVTNFGVEQDELVVPVEHLRQGGAQIDNAAVSNDPIIPDNSNHPGSRRRSTASYHGGCGVAMRHLIWRFPKQTGNRTRYFSLNGR